MHIGILIFVVQIGFAVHVVRAGRPYWWIMLIIFVPLLGCLIYFLAEILPELGQSRAVRNVALTLDQSINAGRDFQTLVDQVEDMPTADNLRALADEMIRRKDYGTALGLYERALAPPNQHDPALLMGLARCHFLMSDPLVALATLDRLREFNPQHRPQEGHLLYARCLDAAGRTEEALAEYAALAPSSPGEEVRARYAELLKRCGRNEEAQALFKAIVRSVERNGRRYRRVNQEWDDVARRNLTT